MAKGDYTELMELAVREIPLHRLPAGELAELVKGVEQAIVGSAKSIGDFSGEFHVSLVNLHSSDAALGFTCSNPSVGAEAAKDVIQATVQEDFGPLPERSKHGIRRLQKRADALGVDLQIFQKGKVVATITPSEAEETTSPISGTTTICGEVEDVGGATPRVALRLRSGRRLPCEIDKDLAKYLARHLYEEVALEGVASWDTETAEIEEFKITGARDFEPASPADLFQGLRRILAEAEEPE